MWEHYSLIMLLLDKLLLYYDLLCDLPFIYIKNVQTKSIKGDICNNCTMQIYLKFFVVLGEFTKKDKINPKYATKIIYLIRSKLT
jgi:hypothetical protein